MRETYWDNPEPNWCYEDEEKNFIEFDVDEYECRMADTMYEEMRLADE